jgi:L-arabinose transport system ATP-binding protein
VAIIYVSHRIKRFCNCATVWRSRDGRLVAVKPAAELNDAEIVRLMVGRELTDVFQRRPSDTGREVLRAEGIHSNWHRNVSFSINAGEVVGFAGLVGAGRTELAKVIFGELPKRSGSVLEATSPSAARTTPSPRASALRPKIANARGWC